MDAFQTDATFFVWLLAFAIPALVVLLVLCIGCPDRELDTAAIDDYQYKPHPSGQLETFRVLRRNPSPPWAPAPRQPDLQRLGSFNLTNGKDNESIPSYEKSRNSLGPTDDDENYVPGYIEVRCPDLPKLGTRKHGRYIHRFLKGSVGEYARSLRVSQWQSLGEYVNA
uniref:Uncharacterized protein n=1 Tax=Sphaerodactylus townsendi TaxID=933632 RepID=A0ACB8EUX5_9SAUR